MKTFDIKIASSALNDLSEIEYHISKVLENPQAAKSVLTEINNSIENAALFPLSGIPSRIPKLAEQGVRYKIVGNYIVFYLTSEDKQEITVMYIKYGGSDLSKLNI